MALLSRLRRSWRGCPSWHFCRVILCWSGLFLRRRRWSLHWRLRVRRLWLLSRLCNDWRLPGKNILKQAQEVDNVRALCYRPIAQIRMVHSAIDTDMLSRTYGHTLSWYHKHHNAFRVCRIGMRYPYCHRKPIDCAAKVDRESA
jgi:hypothetical protein